MRNRSTYSSTALESWPSPGARRPTVMSSILVRLAETDVADRTATNHLAPFAFTEAIMPKLLASSRGGRVIVVSSSAFNMSAVRFDDINFKDGKDCAFH